ncbi:MAG: hypothetical protein ACRDTN_05310, partial [Mycobacterium sp.]
MQPFDFAEPALALGFGYAGFEVATNLLKSGSLRRVRPQQRASHAGMLMNAGCAEGASAGADQDFAALEVAEE